MKVDEIATLVDWQLAQGEPLGCRICGSLWMGPDDECWNCSREVRTMIERDRMLLGELQSAITQCCHLLGDARTNEWLREVSARLTIERPDEHS